VRRPFNVAGVAQAAALAALDDQGHVAASCEAARVGLAALAAGLGGLRGPGGAPIRVLPSLGNFVLVDLAAEAAPVYQALLKRGVITRPMASWGLPRHLRISLGRAAEIERAVAA